jgi:hypothetical protein
MFTLRLFATTYIHHVDRQDQKEDESDQVTVDVQSFIVKHKDRFQTVVVMVIKTVPNDNAD